MKGINALQEWRKSGGKPKGPEYNLIIKSNEDPASRKKAIYAFCFSCMGGNKNELPDPGYKNNIRFCTDKECPLYRFRPYQNFDSLDIKDSEIKFFVIIHFLHKLFKGYSTI